MSDDINEDILNIGMEVINSTICLCRRLHHVGPYDTVKATHPDSTK